MFWHGEQMYRRLSDEVNAAALVSGETDPRPVSEQDLDQLPATAARYLRAMGVLGRPRDWSFCAHLHGRFRLKGHGAWMPAETWQYNSAPDVARIFHMRIDFAGLLPMIGRDVYLHGKGTMHGKLLGLFTVAHAEGPETDLGELTTYLNDAVLFAPSMLLRREFTFGPVDDRSFDVQLVDRGQTVRARVLLDSEGRPANFSTVDRFADLPGGRLVRAEWNTPVEGWRGDGDRMIFDRGRAVWQMPGGPMEYMEIKMAPRSVCYNISSTHIRDRCC